MLLNANIFMDILLLFIFRGKIEGSSLLLLNESDLNDMKIKKGPAKKILRFLQDYPQTSNKVRFFSYVLC